MRLVNQLAELNPEVCTGCSICEKVCPTLSLTMQPNPNGTRPRRLPVIDAESCVGCAACEQRCPEEGALKMIKNPNPHTVSVSLEGLDYAEIEALCRKAKFHPEQILCFCTVTRADEVAAAILKGYDTPELLSRHVGIRTGCKVECVQPILRLLEAAGKKYEPVKGGWQTYGRTPTVWEIPEEIKQKYSSRGFYFDEDIKIMDKVANAPLTTKESDK